METKEQLMQYMDDVNRWEKEQSKEWIWDKVSRLPFKLIDKLTPKFIQKRLGQLIHLLMDYVQTGGNMLISTERTIQNIAKQTHVDVKTIDDLAQLPIETMITLSETLRKNRSNFATLQGATTGFGGVFTIIADIPLILSNALHALQVVAIIHGYDPKSKKERLFIVKALQYAFADTVGRQAILKQLVNGEVTEENTIAQLQGWREVITTYTENFGMKKFMQMIPVVGVIFGAITNKALMEDVVQTGMMLYRKRRIYERIQQIDRG